MLFSTGAKASDKDSLMVQNPFHAFSNAGKFYCDACGCSASGGSMGFTSLLTTNFIGVRYIYQRYSSTDGTYANSPWYKEEFNSVQIWGRIPVFKRVQLTILAPYHDNSQGAADGTKSIHGFGDITVLGIYRIFQTKADSSFFSHTLQLGGGVKIPSGTYNAENNGSINPSFQLGTGSWDYVFLAEHTLRRKEFGFQSVVNYVLKTENQKGYQFGNQFNYSGTFFYLHEKNNLSLSPQVGLAGEVSAANYQYEQRVDKTAGNILFGKFGFEAGEKRLSMGVNLLLPINQDLTGGRVDAKYRLGVNLNYSL
jgi:hypothetical protein